MHIINSLAPVFILIGLGHLLARFDFLPEAFFKGLNRMTYWVALPPLLFYRIAGSDIRGGSSLQIFTVIAAAVVLSLLVSYILVPLIRVPQLSVGAFLQGSFRGNMAFVGLPVVFYSMSDSPEEAGTTAILVTGLCTILYNFLGVVVLLANRPDRKHSVHPIQTFGRQLFSNPLILASLGGILYNVAGWPLPLWIERSCAAVGQAALPMALISIGSALTVSDLKGNPVQPIAAAAVNVGIGPLLGLAGATWIGLAPDDRQIVLILLASPTAVSSYVMAVMMGHDGSLARRIIVYSTIMALVSLSLVIALT